MKKTSSFSNVILIVLIILMAVFLVKLNKKVSRLNKNVLVSSEILREISLSQTHENLVDFLKVYSAYDENGSLKLLRHGKENDGGYVVARKAFEQADALLGYGIDKDNSFEDEFSIIYNKPSYGFDCGIDNISSKSELFTFVDECISSDTFLYKEANTNNKITSFNQQLNNLNLNNKKLFIKMDIEGAEYEALSEIIDHQHNITGLAVEIHFSNKYDTKKALDLLRQLSKHFLLIHVHGNNSAINSGFSTINSIGKIPNVIELSYINKALLSGYDIANNQSHPTIIDQPNNKEEPDAKFSLI